MKRFHFLLFFAQLILYNFVQAQLIPFPEERSKEVDLFPKPVDGYTAQINPPGFAWLAIEGAEYYVVTIQDAGRKDTVIRSEKIHDYVFVPESIINPGDYTWIIEAFNDQGTLISQRRPYALNIPAGLIEQPLPNIDQLLSNMPESHPRLIFTKDKLPEIRESLKTTRKEAWDILKATADASLDLPAPQGPTYGHYDIEKDYIPRRPR